MPIQQLSETVINQIAAGEVVERPASVVKELIENAIDAQSSQIEIFTSSGGKGLIRVKDNGTGIPSEELKLAIARHCTSKFHENIHDIQHLGFRGEALPSIGSVAKLRLVSHTANAETGFEINVNAGSISEIRPASCSQGTVIEVRDLFYVTPARLKFMKSDKTESMAITQIVKNIALAYPEIAFTLNGTDRQTITYNSTNPASELSKARLQRICDILGTDFEEHCVKVELTHQNIKISGFTCIPNFNRGNNQSQFIYVNKRPIRDKLILGAIKAAYSDVITKDRYAVCVLFLELAVEDVDVNVHPAKADVRFRDPSLVRAAIISAIKNALTGVGVRPSVAASEAMANAFIAPSPPSYAPRSTLQPENRFSYAQLQETAPLLIETAYAPTAIAQSAEEVEQAEMNSSFPLGAARAQIHKNYIISQTEDGIIIIDQHAAHERIVYEKLKKALYNEPLRAQLLLVPEIVSLSEEKIDILLSQIDLFKKLGFNFENFGYNCLLVRETPAILGPVNIEELLNELSDKLLIDESENPLEKKINYIAATMACHGSVRSGRLLKTEEMNNLLRQMEETPASSTCNHGRPTYIELKLIDIERLFDRR
ncbi:DNA mismatch repair endonuclease MutL [Bartonella sp. TP]|uniref:DNA mismatch repair endonuclease MutL n=1 Tax=Bartonella sp. TP TaxID=3057550 RepID=UPI0025B1494C|nr:DNA mismatch repair endonuclease MutL [Bartonella sp. TP]WJW80346.1 DNA mismatch repair endonuclease MutL [Bartonella sp. TP]